MKFVYPILLALFLAGCWDKDSSNGSNGENGEEAAQVQEETTANDNGDAHGNGAMEEPAAATEE